MILPAFDEHNDRFLREIPENQGLTQETFENSTLRGALPGKFHQAIGHEQRVSEPKDRSFYETNAWGQISLGALTFQVGGPYIVVQY